MSTLKTTNIQHPSAGSPAVELTAAGGLWLGGGKVLQIVRATDGTNRTTTSTSFVDASISVTITPQKSDSAILLVWSLLGAQTGAAGFSRYQITDNSNNAVSGAQGSFMGSATTSLGLNAMQTLIGYSTPATTSATTYKGRFLATAGTNTLSNNSTPGQLYAIEVSA